jgi:uncharacterized membrane protein YidH (DUF202 family)
MTSAHLAPALVIPFVAWRIYRRVRRNIGRQQLRPKRIKIGIVIFSVLTLLIGGATLTYPPSLAALTGGLLVGVPLAMAGLRLTRFEQTAEGDFYTPNTYIGVTLTLVLVGRMVYRGLVLFGASSVGGTMPPQLFRSPLTLFVFGLTAGYYIAFYAGVLTHVHRRKTAA